MTKNQKRCALVIAIIAFVSIIGVTLYLSFFRKTESEIKKETQQTTMTYQPSPTPTVDVHAGQVKSKITGQWIKKNTAKKRCYAIMINNIEYAFNRQMGTSKADIVYEALAEGGITRMLAIYEDISDVKKIGSVRSARHYYVQFAKEWDAIYCHFGHTKYAVAKMDKLGTDNLSGLSGIGGVVYWRDGNVLPPHNVFTSGKKIKKGAKKLGYSLKRDETKMAEHFQFSQEDTDLSQGKDATKIVIPFSTYSTCQMKYDKDKKVYKKYEYGKKHRDIYYNKQLKFKNVIIQLVKQKNKDHNGYQTMALKDATGKGYYYTNGKRIPIIWKKNESVNAMAYYDEEGKLLTINPGKTYIAVYPDSRKKLIK